MRTSSACIYITEYERYDPFFTIASLPPEIHTVRRIEYTMYRGRKQGNTNRLTDSVSYLCIQKIVPHCDTVN
jgi:hypothetical protein